MNLAFDSFLHVVDYLPIVILYKLSMGNVACWKYLQYRIRETTVLVELLNQLENPRDFTIILNYIGHQGILECLIEHHLNLQALDAIGSWTGDHESIFDNIITEIIEEQRKQEFRQRRSTRIRALCLLYTITFLFYLLRTLFILVIITISLTISLGIIILVFVFEITTPVKN